MTTAFYPMVFSKLEQMQTDPGDTRFVNFVLEYEYRWLRGDRVAPEFWSPGIFFPERNALAYSDVFVSILPFYACWRSLRAEPDTAYQFFLLTVGGLNFIAAYLLLRNALGRTVAVSSFGAFLFSFGSIRMNQLGHPQLVVQFYPLISLYGLVRIFSGDSEGSASHFGWWLALFYAGITAQFYSDYYHGWFYLFALGLCFLWGLINSDVRPRLRDFLRSKWKWLAAGFLLWAVSLIPLAIHYWQAAKRLGFRDFREAEVMLPRFQSWFYVGSENWLWGWLMRHKVFEELPMSWEHRVGLGLVTTAIFVYMLWRGRKSLLIQIFTFVCLAVILLSTLYRGQISPWAVVFHVVPGANGIRAVSRVAFLLLFPASYAFALFVELSLAARMRTLLFPVCILSVMEQGRTQASYEKQEIRRAVESVARRIDAGRCEYFYYSPSGTSDPGHDQLDAMHSYLATGVPTLNGYSGNAPRDWRLEDPRIGSPADALRLSGKLSDWLQTHGLSRSGLCWIR